MPNMALGTQKWYSKHTFSYFHMCWLVIYTINSMDVMCFEALLRVFGAFIPHLWPKWVVSGPTEAKNGPWYTEMIHQPYFFILPYMLVSNIYHKFDGGHLFLGSIEGLWGFYPSFLAKMSCFGPNWALKWPLVHGNDTSTILFHTPIYVG